MAVRGSLRGRLRRIELLILDVDGVLTDGGIYYGSRGAVVKRFHAHDGYGVVRAREHGLRLAIVSGRSTPIVTARARDLGITDLLQAANDKVAACAVLKKKHDLDDGAIAFIGDDLFDLPLLGLVGFSAAPADARPEVRRAVDYVTRVAGGQGRPGR